MFIHSGTIERFKNIQHVEFSAEGNHIVITGMNGAGKTVVLEALLTLLFGKKVLPDDPVMHGEESALMSCGISGEKGGEIRYKIKARVTGKNFGLEVSTFDVNGAELSVKKPTEFLSTLVTRDFIDPDEFCRKEGKDRIAMLYKLLPGLQEQMDKLTAAYEAEQLKRSHINIDKSRLEVELRNTPFTEGLPEAEIDPASMVTELQAAEKHNLSKKTLENDLNDIDAQIDRANEMAQAAAHDIELLEKQIAQKRELIDRMSEQITALAARKADTSKVLEQFVPADVEVINEKIRGLNTTNENIRHNRKYLDLKKQLEEKSAEYSKGLTEMKAIEQKKIAVYKEAKMPVDGLAIGNTDVTYPDPITGEVVMFGSLSTGQKIRVSVGILAAFLPPPEKGLRCMVINDANAMDEKNYTSMLEAANSNGVQLIMHRTVFKSESNKLEILIEER